MTSRLLATLVAAMLACACSEGHRSPTAPTGSGGRRTTFVALGHSAALSGRVEERLRLGWPYVVFREAFPVSTVFVNGTEEAATAEQALANQVPLVAELHPDVIALWVGVDDRAERR